MFRFFRKIRLKLYQEGKVSKYLGYAIGEIALIVVGILIAVKIGEWNQGLRDRIEEREILGRTYDELGGNIERMADGAQGAPSWIERIDRLIAAFEGAPIEDNIAFLDDAIGAATFGVRKQLRTAYIEFLSNGKFGLIQNVELRNSIIGYYEKMEGSENRNYAFVGDYARLAFQLIPRTGGNGDLREGLSDEYYATLVQRVLESDLRNHILHERNRSEFTKYMFETLIEDANGLLAAIEAELAN